MKKISQSRKFPGFLARNVKKILERLSANELNSRLFFSRGPHTERGFLQ